MFRPTLFSNLFAVGIAVVAGLPAVAQQSKTGAAQPQAKPPATTPVASETPVSPLPGGASSLTEQHGDWTVSCGIAQNVKQCGFSQVIGNTDTGKRALSIQLRPVADNKVNGIVITQFGLRLDAGVRFVVDDRPLLGPMGFLTCVENGCLVPVSFDTAAVASLKSGTTLKVSAVAVNAGQSVALTLSLKGFGDALTRTADLLK